MKTVTLSKVWKFTLKVRDYFRLNGLGADGIVGCRRIE